MLEKLKNKGFGGETGISGNSSAQSFGGADWVE